jgi:hypothetical protein
MAINEIRKISASEQFVYDSLITQLLTVTVGHVI